ncbi:MAG: hypothetical protein ACM3XS_06310 [Bacteroidota bacterium]
MFGDEDRERARKAVAKLGGNDDRKNDRDCLNLTPAQLLVIAGFLAGVLEVESVSVDKDQQVEISLSGSLKRRTELEIVMEQVGKMPFEQVVRAIMENSM